MFNALKFSKELEDAGFSREQAEAAINVFYRFMEHNFATKEFIKNEISDVRSEMSEIKSEISELRHDLNHGLQSLEYRMTIRLGSLLIVGLTVIGTLMKFWLPH